MSELDLAFDPAPDTVRLNEAGEPEPVQDRLRSAEPWIQDLNQWLELMRAMPGHACPDQVRDAEIVSLGLQLTDDATIAELNGSWRQKPHPTDVQGVMDGDLDPFIQALLRQGVDSPGTDEDG